MHPDALVTRMAKKEGWDKETFLATKIYLRSDRSTCGDCTGHQVWIFHSLNTKKKGTVIDSIFVRYNILDFISPKL